MDTPLLGSHQANGCAQVESSLALAPSSTSLALPPLPAYHHASDNTRGQVGHRCDKPYPYQSHQYTELWESLGYYGGGGGHSLVARPRGGAPEERGLFHCTRPSS